MSGDPRPGEPAGEPQAATAGVDYARRLQRLEGAWWKRLLDVQRPYRWNVSRWHLGRTLDVGCGIGRNLASLGPDSVGVDHNARSVELARERGLTAYTPEEFFADERHQPGAFDAMLVAHVVEHMAPDQAREVVAGYLPMVRAGGTVLFICPQERGYASDATHVTFTDDSALTGLARGLGMEVLRSYSFPFPRVAGRVFLYNEFCVAARVPA